MKVCYTAGPVKKLENCFSVSTNAVEIRIWFLTDDILRIRAGFDGDWDEASYSLTMTAWDSRTDELMKDCRKRVQTAAAELTDFGNCTGVNINSHQVCRTADCVELTVCIVECHFVDAVCACNGCNLGPAGELTLGVESAVAIEFAGRFKAVNNAVVRIITCC